MAEEYECIVAACLGIFVLGFLIHIFYMSQTGPVYQSWLQWFHIAGRSTAGGQLPLPT